MKKTDELDRIKKQEHDLVLPAFNEHIAFDLGMLVRKRALAEGLSIVVDIRSWDRQLFFTALPGTSFNNSEWVRRKGNTVRRFQKSTQRIMLERGGEGVFPPQVGANPADYVMAGGGFPLRVANSGIVGCIVVSGLSGQEDHNLTVKTLCDYLQLDKGVYINSAQ